jgi:hypothetical protein
MVEGARFLVAFDELSVARAARQRDCDRGRKRRATEADVRLERRSDTLVAVLTTQRVRMSIYIDANGRLHHDQERSLALVCPHCQVYSHITAVSVPQYSEIAASRPEPGRDRLPLRLVQRADLPQVRGQDLRGNRVELSNNFVELERAQEKFNFTFLPENDGDAFREALACYSNGSFNAFGSMCRRTTQAMFQDLGENGRLRVFDQVNEAREMARSTPTRST